MTSAEILKDHNIKPSVIRVMIYDYICTHKIHATADEIYNALVESVPTLSKTTVYNTVNLLSKQGILKTITIDGVQTRYDGDTSMHGHFLCEKCGKVYDFRLDEVEVSELDGFEIGTKEVYYGGVCRQCNKK